MNEKKNSLIIRVLKRIYKFNIHSVDNHFKSNRRIENLADKISKEVFTGGPVESFEKAGKLQLITLLKFGLLPESKLLDIGCGALRGGYWCINFLKSGNYFGIEPNKSMLETGKRVLLGTELLNEKRPSFSNNDQFNLDVFDTKFDYLIARSIWTHASLDQINKMLDQFILVGNPNAILLTSYLKAGLLRRQYKGRDWKGISHQSDKKGLAYYKFRTIKRICNARGLNVKQVNFDVMNNQYWLQITRQ